MYPTEPLTGQEESQVPRGNPPWSLPASGVGAAGGILAMPARNAYRAEPEIINTDQCSQFASAAFTDKLAAVVEDEDCLFELSTDMFPEAGQVDCSRLLPLQSGPFQG